MLCACNCCSESASEVACVSVKELGLLLTALLKHCNAVLEIVYGCLL